MQVTPHDLARRRRPVTFVDVVDGGNIFNDLFDLLRDWIDEWIDEQREPWPAIRRKVRFVGVTVRRATSPNTYRWQQKVSWTRQLPAHAAVNVSLDGTVWSYLGDYQTKLPRSLRPDRWPPEVDGPGRDERTGQALAEAAVLVAYGRSRSGRHALARAIGREPALRQSGLRTLSPAPESPHSTFGTGSRTASVPRLFPPSRRTCGASRSTTGSLTMTKAVPSTDTYGP
jgi:hypothetical protein